MNCFIPGINGIPEYVVYLDKDERKKRFGKKLPPIKKKEPEEDIQIIPKKLQVIEKKEEKDRSAENNNKPIINTTQYKEEQFQPTQLEVLNLQIRKK